MAPKPGNSKTFRLEQHICEIPTVIPTFAGAPNPQDVSLTQANNDQHPEIKYSGVFPVCGFRVGFSDICRNLALKYIIPLHWA